MSITEQMNNAFNLFSNGNKEKAEQIVLQVLMSANPIDFYSWWLTETNPEYMLSSKEFLIFIKNVVISNQDKIINKK